MLERDLAVDGSRRSVHGPAWSADGEHLAWWRVNADDTADIVVGDARGRHARVFASCPGCGLDSPFLSSDGEQLGYVRWDDITGTLVIASFPGGKVLASVPFSDADLPIAPQFSPDGAKVAFVRETWEGEPGVGDLTATRIVVLDLDSGEETDVGPRDAWAMHPDWSPDGRQIVFMAGNPDPLTHEGPAENLFVADVDGSRVTQLTHQQQGQPWLGFPDWSDGCLLATMIEPGQFWYTATVADDGSPEALVEDGHPAYGVGPRLKSGDSC